MKHADHQRQRAEQIVLVRSHLARQHRGGLAARTTGRDIDLLAAGDFAHRLHRLAAGTDIIGHVPHALFLARILPADDEGLDAVIELVLYHRLLGREVVDVHLVDLRRDGELRDPVDFVGGRGVLDQFHHLGAQDYRAFRSRDILAQFEGLLVNLADHALVVDHIVIGVLEALDQAQAATGDRHLLRAGIADQRVCGGQPVNDDVRDEARPVLLELVQLEVFQPVCRSFLDGQIVLHARTHEGVVLPGRVLETLILGVRRQIALAGHDLDHVLAHDLTVLHDALRVGSRFAQHDGDSAEDILSRQPHQGAEGAGVLCSFVFESGHVEGSPRYSLCFFSSASLRTVRAARPFQMLARPMRHERQSCCRYRRTFLSVPLCVRQRSRPLRSSASPGR